MGRNILKILFIGLVTTIVRIIGQLLIPTGEQFVLAPSVFALNRTMPLAFTLYGLLAYSLIAAMFLLIRNRLSGNRILQGVRYGLSCSVVWVVYLLEPLPHVAPLDKITYPLADSLALIVMGLLLGWLLGESKKPPISYLPYKISVTPMLLVVTCFILGRLIQYFLIPIYSSFETKTVETMLWSLGTGFVIAYVMAWLNRYIPEGGKIKRALMLGGLLFGVDLALFNFFMPLVFNANISDLIIRTLIDILAVTVGCLAFSEPQNFNYQLTKR